MLLVAETSDASVIWITAVGSVAGIVIGAALKALVDHLRNRMQTSVQSKKLDADNERETLRLQHELEMKDDQVAIAEYRKIVKMQDERISRLEAKEENCQKKLDDMRARERGYVLWVRTMELRIESYKEALKEAGIPFRPVEADRHFIFRDNPLPPDLDPDQLTQLNLEDNPPENNPDDRSPRPKKK